MRRLVVILLATACTESTTAPRVATIWRNGNAGCWRDAGDECDVPNGHLGKVVGAMSGASFAIVDTADDVTGGMPSMSVIAPNGSGFFSFCIGSQSFNMCEQRDLTAFAHGHLAFDLRVESDTVTKLAIELFPALSVELPLAELRGSRFVHQSIPLAPDLFGSDGPTIGTTVFKLVVTAPPSQESLALINNIVWTTD